ncbi:hypothetical protein CEXT_559771 [Caerostris extrusa]|uniref:Uncharacterized protein n=1 Tax=Caerostris extrusa TaxID=172846 RepID=A0AAV4QK27_CAEEX|nr:hypothetical protein CEXT_559771 [Caerostris extrusa]
MPLSSGIFYSTESGIKGFKFRSTRVKVLSEKALTNWRFTSIKRTAGHIVHRPGIVIWPFEIFQHKSELSEAFDLICN